jgi:hypothetical protein
LIAWRSEAIRPICTLSRFPSIPPEALGFEDMLFSYNANT